jgi:peptide chain release factor 3
MVVFDAKNRPLILFESEWSLRHTTEKERDLEYHDIAP